MDESNPVDQSGTNESSVQPEESSNCVKPEGEKEDCSRTSPKPESDTEKKATAVDISDSKGVSTSKPCPPCTREFKDDLSDFERGMINGAWLAGSSVANTASVLGFSRTTVSKLYREFRKTSNVKVKK